MDLNGYICMLGNEELLSEHLEHYALSLGMPAEVVSRLSPEPAFRAEIRALSDPHTAERAAEKLCALLVPDEDGFRILSCMLLASMRTQLGRLEQFRLDTMKCFVRFAEEYRAQYGRYGFDRAMWTWRQTSGMLVRIGSLEYEIKEDEVSIHIPSDADLEGKSVRASLKRARDLLPRLPFTCYSWLLSPKLKRLLPEDSNILRFRSMFRKFRYNSGDDSYRLWVFKDPRLSPRDYPEDTTLQRNMKKFVLHGGKVGAAFGVLREKS